MKTLLASSCPLPTAHCLLPAARCLLPAAVADVVIVVWLFALGGAVGSFLNVVIYRLPAAKSLILPGSHCPACKHPIRWYDNMPMLSWILLRGRCRDCQADISPRYPIVEAITATLFAAVGYVEGFSGGANLPLPALVDSNGAVLPPLSLGESATLVGYHLLLVCTLFAAAMIEYDGHRTPARLWGPALSVGLAVPLVWPHLHPVPAWSGSHGPAASFISGVIGLVLGVLMGKIAWSLTGGTDQRIGLWLALPCVGLFLGWQAALVLTLSTVLLHLLFLALRKLRTSIRPVPPTVWLAGTTLVWVLAWEWFADRLPILA